MDKRYQVFVSSTYEDLRAERQEVMQALLELDCIPSGMELFPAADEDKWSLIKNVINDCDYYIVVIGGRYGSVVPAGLSYTQMEYEYAAEQGKPIIAFLHKDPESLPVNKCEKTQIGRESLNKFRELVQKKACRFWTSPADLGSVVSRSLIKLIKDHPAVGWVRADLLPDQSTAEEILRLKKRNEELEEQLRTSFGTLPAGIEHLAQGDDSIELKYSFGVYKTPADRFGYRRHEATYENTFITNWNTLFAIVSPLLIDEASDRTVKQALNSFLEDQNIAKLKKESRFKGYELSNFALGSDDFNTVKVQLLALRLITKSTKKKTRSVSDRDAYWMLTPYGEEVMMSLRALKRIRRKKSMSRSNK